MASMDICINDLVENIGEHFRGVVQVNVVVEAEDGSKVEASDSSCFVNRHLIELEFTKDTRKHFKSGLPYRGKVCWFVLNNASMCKFKCAIFVS